MPIRFRCAYCNQLMGIAHRKAGTVVRCPQCQGQVVVPTPETARPPGLIPSTEAPPGTGPVSTAPAGVFEESDFEKIFQEPQPLGPPDLGMPPVPASVPAPSHPGTMAEPKGLVLSPGWLTVLCVLVMLLIGIAFFVGVLLGRASVGDSGDAQLPSTNPKISPPAAFSAGAGGSGTERSRS